MNRFLKIYLVVTGILAVVGPVVALFLSVLSLLFPPLRLLAWGLGTAPVLFLYGAVFAAGWFPARSRLGAPGAFVVGGAAAACLAGVTPLLVNEGLETWTARVRAEDKLPSDPVPISGVLRIERDGSAYGLGSHPERLACDTFCAAALFTPGVEAVVVALSDDARPREMSRRDDHTAAYRLQRGECPVPLLPRSGADFDLRELPDTTALHTSHLLALADGRCLVFDDTIPAADWTLRLDRRTLWGGDRTRSSDPPDKLVAGVGPFDPLGTITRTRLSLDGRGARVLQQTRVDTQPLAVPLFAAAVGGFFNFQFGWYRREHTDGRFDPIALLARTTRLRLSPSTSPTPAPTAEAVRTALTAALDDPALPAGAAGLRLIGPMLRAMDPREVPPIDVRPDDAALIARAVADLRVPESDIDIGLASAIRALGPSAHVLRGPMVARLLSTPVTKDRRDWSGLGFALALLPPGTFATLTPDEERLLADPERQRWVTGLIERLTDRGASGVPQLIDVIARAYARRAIENGWSGPDDARAALRAVCRLGPASGDGFAKLAKLIETGAVPRSVLDEREWQFTLARLSGSLEPVTTIGDVSASRPPDKRQPWPILVQFKPEYCQ